MSSTVFLRLYDDDKLDMYLADGDSFVQSETATTLDEIAPACRGKKLVVLIPGQDVHLSVVDLPIRNRQKVMQAIPYALEEDLIGDIRQFHFALPARLPAEAIPVCAIAKNRLDELIDQLHAHHLNPQVMTPSSTLLPCHDRQWNLIIEDQQTIIQQSDYVAYSVDTEELELYLTMAIDQAEEQAPTQLNIIDARSADEEPLLENLESSPLEIVRTSPPTSLLELMVKNYNESNIINVLQGPYAIRKMAHESLKKWYPALVLLVIVICLQLFTSIARYHTVSKEAALLQDQITQVFQQTMPDVKRMTNPKNQMQQRLKELKASQLGGETDFLKIMTKVAQASQQHASIEIIGINYRNGRVDIDLNIKDLQSLEQFKEKMSTSGLSVDIRSAAVQGKSVSARMRIQENS